MEEKKLQGVPSIVHAIDLTIAQVEQRVDDPDREKNLEVLRESRSPTIGIEPRGDGAIRPGSRRASQARRFPRSVRPQAAVRVRLQLPRRLRQARPATPSRRDAARLRGGTPERRLARIDTDFDNQGPPACARKRVPEPLPTIGSRKRAQ